MTYLQAINYLNSFINYECLTFYPYKSSFKLERARRFMQLLGSPHQCLRIIHIAGTKGKGSTCAFVANILKAAGFKVGLYTSPHLVDVRERIRILQSQVRCQVSQVKDQISRKDFARLIKWIKPYAEKLRVTKLGRLSFYEILTAMAFLYFSEKKCDFVVLETGMGGRLDATNVASSLVCAITPISYDHTEVLGDTLEEIATEKTGIIKFPPTPRLRRAGKVLAYAKASAGRQSSRLRQGFGGQAKFKVAPPEEKRQVVITAPQRPVALKIIKRRAQEVGAVLFEVGKDILIKENHANLNRQIFAVQGILGHYPRMKIRLLGRHQLINAACAIGCVEALRFYGVKVSSWAIKEGLKNTHWPGRLQIISLRPRIVVDAAHNQASASALKDALNKFFNFRQLILVMGITRDKDIKGIVRELTPLASKIILTKAQNPRAMEPKLIKTFIKTNAKPIILTDNSRYALKVARESARANDLILVSGSVFLVGEVLKNKIQ